MALGNKVIHDDKDVITSDTLSFEPKKVTKAQYPYVILVL